jgi:hypothetical protein
MSTNNLPDNMPSVERLLMRISAAEKSNQKEIKITIQEARALSIDLALLTSKLGKTITEVRTLLTKIQKDTGEVDVKFDGGSF